MLVYTALAPAYCVAAVAVPVFVDIDPGLAVVLASTPAPVFAAAFVCNVLVLAYCVAAVAVPVFADIDPGLVVVLASAPGLVLAAELVHAGPVPVSAL